MPSRLDKTPSGDHADAQRFGGPWTLIKTRMVGNYIRFFNTALQHQPFERIYIDAFAGSGAFQWVSDVQSGDLFKSGPGDDVHAGSAQLALSVQPPFHSVHFIEQKRANVSALQKLIARSGHSGARVERGDANARLLEICRSTNWANRRGVIFLDPFGMNVRWETLEAIAATGALDVWYLFALTGAARNLPHRFDRLDKHKLEAVTRVLGTNAWLNEFYEPSPGQPMLRGLECPSAVTKRQVKSIDQLEVWFRDRLLRIFPHVEPPKRLPPHFSLFFAMSNPAPRAITLARKGAAYILSNA